MPQFCLFAYLEGHHIDMKWKDLRQSQNVEIDCLGQRAQMGGPETEAAFKCQAEVADLKQRVTQESSMQGLISGTATDDASIAAQNAKTMAEFDNQMSMFILINDVGSPLLDGKSDTQKGAGLTDSEHKPNRFEKAYKDFESIILQKPDQ